MKPCPACSQVLDDADPACRYCGADLTERPPAAAPPPAPAAPVPVPVEMPDATRASAGSGWTPHLATLAAVSLALAATMLVWLGGSSVPAVTPDAGVASPPPAAVAEPTPAAADVAALAEPAAPKWHGGPGSSRARGRAAMTLYEVDAERSVPVWMRRVRPVLSVRCDAGATEAYVVTNWPASMESAARRHTVRLAFDGEDEIAEQWQESEDAQALFAPDGIALARRLAGARTLRFGFTPFNAAPVVAEFDVHGFDALVGAVARSCRWKP